LKTHTKRLSGLRIMSAGPRTGRSSLFAWVFPFLVFLFSHGAFAEVSQPTHPVEAAKAAIKAKKDKDAAALLSDFVQTNPRAPEAAEALLLLGRIQVRQRQIDEAFRSFGWIAQSARGTEWAAKALEETAKLHKMRRNRTSAQQARDTLLRDYPASRTAAPYLWERASSQFEAGNYREATEWLEKYLASPHAKSGEEVARMRDFAGQAAEGSPAKAEALAAEQHLERAEALFERRLYVRAQDEFNRALKLADSTDLRLNISVRISQCLAMVGEDRLAARMINRETMRDPSSLPRMALRMATDMADLPMLRNLTEHCLGASLRRFPKEAETRQALLQFAATTAHILKDHASAVPRYREFLQRYPASPEAASAHYQLAAALYYLEDLPSAEVHFREALAAGPGESLKSEIEKFLNVLGRAKEASEYLAALPAEERDFFQAKRLYTQKRFDKGAEIFQRLRQNNTFRQHQQFREALFLLGDCFEKTGKWSQASSTYEEVIRMDGQDELAAHSLAKIGSIHLFSNNFAQAASCASRLDDFDELPAVAYDFLWKHAILQIAEGNAANAKVSLARCAAPLAPASIKGGASRILDLLAANTESEESQDSTVEAVNDLSIRIGEDLIQDGRFEMAEALLSRLSQRKITCQPDRVAFLLGAVLLVQEKIEPAKAAFQTVLGQYPQSQFVPLATIRLAIIYTGWMEDPDSGGKLLEKAVNNYPDSPYRPRALFFLATLHLWNDNPHRSLALFDQLVAEYPSADETPYALVNIENLKTQHQIP